MHDLHYQAIRRPTPITYLVRGKAASDNNTVIPAQAGIYTNKSNMKKYYVYILVSVKNGTLYIGVTDNLIKRAHQHKAKQTTGFTQKYNVHQLVHFEEYTDINEAITREKRLKKWKRQWKIELIENDNPQWRDLFKDII